MVGISFNNPRVIESEIFILDHKQNWITVDGPVFIMSLERFSEKEREFFKKHVQAMYDNLCLKKANV